MGAIVPKKKTSKTRRNQRHGQWQRGHLKRMANELALTTCQNCNAPKLSHRVCKECGYYRGRQVISIKASSGSVIDA